MISIVPALVRRNLVLCRRPFHFSALQAMKNRQWSSVRKDSAGTKRIADLDRARPPPVMRLHRWYEPLTENCNIKHEIFWSPPEYFLRFWLSPILVSRSDVDKESFWQKIKQVQEKIDGNTITVEGQFVDSARKPKLLNLQEPNGACPLCRLNVKLSYSDVLVLEQFMRPDGTVLPKQVTGLCMKQQVVVERLVQQAHWAGLFPHHKPKSYNEEVERGNYKQFNRYFDEHYDMFALKTKVKPGSFYYVHRY